MGDMPPGVPDMVCMREVFFFFFRVSVDHGWLGCCSRYSIQPRLLLDSLWNQANIKINVDV